VYFHRTLHSWSPLKARGLRAGIVAKLAIGFGVDRRIDPLLSRKFRGSDLFAIVVMFVLIDLDRSLRWWLKSLGGFLSIEYGWIGGKFVLIRAGIRGLRSWREFFNRLLNRLL
jgi:hypothetical protein